MEDRLLNRLLVVLSHSGDKPFITTVENGITRSFNQFFSDVFAVSYEFNKGYAEVSVIAVKGKNSYEFAVFAVAAILSGKTFFPLNPNEPEGQLIKQLNLLTEKYHLFSGDNLNIPGRPPAGFKLSGTLPDRDIVYMATSATTGDSKIVRQREASILANVDDLIFHHDLKRGRKIITSLPLFHVNALHFSFLCSLLSGGRLYLMESFNPRQLFETIQTERIEIASLIPVLLNNLLNNAASLKAYDLTSLDYFVSAAAPLSVQIVQGIKKEFGKRILQGYGLSEAVNFSCVLPRQLSESQYEDLMLRESFPSIGIALQRSLIKIVNDKNEECQEGESGELHLKGAYVMPGYLGTEEGFNEGYFLTGDLGYYKNFNGVKYYFISGRKKEIAKVSGESVSLRELDELIKQSITTKNDFFSTFFVNSFRGEELALICSINTGDNVDEIFASFEKSLKSLPPSRMPKVLLFTNKPTRTASGKARRFLFKEEFAEFAEKRFFNQIIRKII